MRPKACKLAMNPVLREHVATGVGLQWSPEQIAGWLRVESPDEPELRVSHETIYLSLFVVQAPCPSLGIPAAQDRCSRCRAGAGRRSYGA